MYSLTEAELIKKIVADYGLDTIKSNSGIKMNTHKQVIGVDSLPSIIKAIENNYAAKHAK